MLITLLQRTSLSPPRSYNAYHVPAFITSVVLMLLKRSLCVCRLVDSAVLAFMLLFRLFALNLCRLLSNATQNSRNKAVRSTSGSQTPGSDITRYNLNSEADKLVIHVFCLTYIVKDHMAVM